VAIHVTNEEGSKRFVKLKYDGLHYVGEGETLTIAQKLGMRNKVVFETLALHQNEMCVTDLTIDQVAEMLNTSSSTIKTSVKELEKFQYEGKPIMLKSQVGRGRKQQNVYTILPNPLVSTYGEESLGVNSDPKNDSLGVKSTPTKEDMITKEVINKKNTGGNNSMSKKFVVTTFRDLLKEKGIEDKFSYPQVYAKMKKSGVDPLFEGMKEEQVKNVLTFIVNEYGNGAIKSDLIKFPLNIQVVTRKWVVEKAIQLHDKEQKKVEEDMSRIEEQSVEATRRNKKSISSIMDRVKKNKGGNK
jgi:hypothetical protein